MSDALPNESEYKVDEIYIVDDDKGKVFCVRVKWRHCNAEEGEPEAVEWSLLGYRLETCIDFGEEMTFPWTEKYLRWRQSADFSDYYESEIQDEVNALREKELTQPLPRGRPRKELPQTKKRREK